MQRLQLSQLARAVSTTANPPAAIPLRSIDHLVLTVASIERTCEFYSRVFGCTVHKFGANRTALSFGAQKFNLHELGKEIAPNAANANTGTVDICLLTDVGIEDVKHRLQQHGVALESDIVDRTGARGPIRSIYIRDPDRNLVELSNYQQ